MDGADTGEQKSQRACLNQLLFGIYFLCQTVTLSPVVHFPFLFWTKTLLLFSLRV